MKNNLSTDRFNMITIGELSKLTGVNIKSLRYYEKIKVLSPFYVNPENGYRYYTQSQVQLVIAIQFYVNMDIPLNELYSFIDMNTETIHFREQISYSIDVAKRKIRQIEQQLDHAEFLRTEIDRCDEIKKSVHPIKCHLPEKHCFRIEATGNITEAKYYQLLRRLLFDMHNSDFNSGCETGLLCLREDNAYRNYVFVDVNPDRQSLLTDNRYFVIPENEYTCTTTSFDEFSDLLFESNFHSLGNPELLICSELFTSNYDYRHPEFELRWYV
jgi:MerR family transcriptional regulator, activator of bmr gene